MGFQTLTQGDEGEPVKETEKGQPVKEANQENIASFKSNEEVF